MAYLRTILTDNHPTLRKMAKRYKASEIIDPLTQQLIEDMLATMYAAPGIGLAAPQIGVSKRMFVVDLQDREGERIGPLVVFNPRFTLTEGEVELIEGCLSVPGFIGDVTRFEHVVCAGLDQNGEKVEYDAMGLFAQCLQHEMDHLDGILYTDKARNVRPAVTQSEIDAAEGGTDAPAAQPEEIALSN
ncbi:MAG TPA: peptide deformylase [Candidatus Binatia bacterium]|nr:peptide deformylase [Candidatus Binatia bacterium]